MVNLSKQKSFSERARTKYVRTRSRTRQHPLSPKQIRMFEEKAKQKLSPEQIRRKQLEHQKMISEIRREKNPDKLAERMKQAKKNGLGALLQQDADRLKKMQKAQERLKEAVKRLLSDRVSASVKDGASQIQSGHVAAGLRNIRETGRDGAVGNDIAGASSELAENAQILSGLTGKHFDSIMYRTLRDNARPADSINQQKDKDGRDQNLEGRITQKSTARQMIEKKRSAGR